MREKLDRAVEISREAELIRKAKTGNDLSFADLLQIHAGKGFGTAVAILRNREDAEEAVQDAALTAFRSLGHLHEERAFGAWFSRIVVNKAIDKLRQRNRGPMRAAVDEEQLPQTQDVDLEGHLDLVGAVARLTPEQRAIVSLHYTEGLSTVQIAQLLGKAEGTIRRKLSECYRELRLLLREE